MRRARLLLGALAVIVSVPVGFATAATVPGPPAGLVVVEAQLLAPSPSPELALAGFAAPTPAVWTSPDGRQRSGSLQVAAGLAQGATIAVALDTSGTPVTPQPRLDDPLVVGFTATTATLLTCWAMLAFLVMVWRRRLDAIDDMRWTDEWTWVEPSWSGRA